MLRKGEQMRAIDADALKEWIENWFTKNRFYHPYAKNNNIPITELYDILEQMPTIEPERKKGRWLPDNNSVYEMRFVCSECHESEVVPTIGFTKYKPIWDYCPNCGARMEGKS